MVFDGHFSIHLFCNGYCIYVSFCSNISETQNNDRIIGAYLNLENPLFVRLQKQHDEMVMGFANLIRF